MNIQWAVWYDDGSSFTSADGAPHEAALGCAIAVSFVLACLMAVGLFARPY